MRVREAYSMVEWGWEFLAPDNQCVIRPYQSVAAGTTPRDRARVSRPGTGRCRQNRLSGRDCGRAFASVRPRRRVLGVEVVRAEWRAELVRRPLRGPAGRKAPPPGTRRAEPEVRTRGELAQ